MALETADLEERVPSPLSYIDVFKLRCVTVQSLAVWLWCKSFAPKRGLEGPGLAFRTPESARKVHAKSSGP